MGKYSQAKENAVITKCTYETTETYVVPYDLLGG